jgi:hypothetical protein
MRVAGSLKLGTVRASELIRSLLKTHIERVCFKI